ncbi:protein TESPA1-like [Brachionichthys hirsutus]|uniref:protein TESPA1-like n=1 Tax=Brachionichthys hirsutus TaxID=412623 RepID=UPI0036045155
MESPSSSVRRRAWINSSRQWHSPEELDPEEPLCSLPSASIADDDVFSDGCTTGKIENWLLGCGSEECSANSEPTLKANHSEEELSLGADGFVCSTSHQALCFPSVNLGHSMASSCPSSSTCTSASSLLEVLQLHSEDAEERLYELGFGCDEPQVTVRVPPRFFTFPSLARGINFRLFLDSQLQRIREEDPSLSLASRFRQVQVLTAMANAFYSLYSHVTRTPLQKLPPPEFSFSSSPVERIERFRSSVRSEPRSPVERLKDTVSKMCLYTGSPRGSESTSPQPSPKKRSSFPSISDIALEKVKSGAIGKVGFGQCESSSALDVNLLTDGDKSCDRREEEEQMDRSNTDALCIGNKMRHEETQDSKQRDIADSDEGKAKAAGLDSKTRGVRTSVSEETVIKTRFLSRQLELGFCSAHSDSSTAHLKPAAFAAHDLIYPQRADGKQRAPSCSRDRNVNASSLICSETEHAVRSHPGLRAQRASEYDEDSYSDVTRSLPVLASNDAFASCCITVTSSSPNAPDPNRVSTAQMCEESFNEERHRYLLNPSSYQGRGNTAANLQQANSFELEEVQSAGEAVRADTVSMQSDSSGYADE